MIEAHFGVLGESIGNHTQRAEAARRSVQIP
jgi:hypothetical protein